MDPQQDTPEQQHAALSRQRSIAITLGAIILVVVLFGAFLMALSSDDEPPKPPAAAAEAAPPSPPHPAPAVRSPLEKSIDYEYNPAAADAASAAEQELSLEQPSDPDEPQGSVIAAAPGESGAVLYCDSFATEALAQAQKARLAFAGVQSSVVHYENQIMLRIGPFGSRNEARDKFNQLAALQLLRQCSLTDE